MEKWKSKQPESFTHKNCIENNQRRILLNLIRPLSLPTKKVKNYCIKKKKTCPLAVFSPAAAYLYRPFGSAAEKGFSGGVCEEKKRF